MYADVMAAHLRLFKMKNTTQYGPFYHSFAVVLAVRLPYCQSPTASDYNAFGCCYHVGIDYNFMTMFSLENNKTGLKGTILKEVHTLV